MLRFIREHNPYPEENKASTLPALPLLHLVISCWQPSPFSSPRPLHFPSVKSKSTHSTSFFYVLCACLSLTHYLLPRFGYVLHWSWASEPFLILYDDLQTASQWIGGHWFFYTWCHCGWRWETQMIDEESDCNIFVTFAVFCLISFFFLLPVLVFLALLLNPSLSVGTSRKGKGWFKWQEFLSCPSDRRTQTHTASVYTHKHTRSEGCIQHVHIAASERASLYVFLCEQDSLPSVCSSTVHRKPSDYIRH